MAFTQSYPTTIVYPTLENRIHRVKNLFKLFVSFLKDAELIGCEIIAIDGTNRAHNSKKANFNQRK
jgi:hypothetical protein